MADNVYCVIKICAMTILEGIAEYNGKKYYFFEDISLDEYVEPDMYYCLTLLDDNVFNLSMENWEYWKMWLKRYIKPHFKINPTMELVPHPVDYAERRKTMTMEKIFSNIKIKKDLKNTFMELTEKYYQNDKKIKEYIKNHKPIYKAKGIFNSDFGSDIMGLNNTEVIWENLVKI